MGSGIIIDDGGSTRIKWNGRESGSIIKGKLEGLMDVREEKDTGISTHEIYEDDPYLHIRITYQDKYGYAEMINHDLALHMKVRVLSFLNQNLQVERVEKGLILSLFGAGGGPMVEARQHNRARRYIVMNSGSIEKVSLEYEGNSADIYDATTILPDERKPVIYTSVVLF